MAGFMIDNIANGTLKQWFISDLENLPKNSCTLLDTRTAGEFERGHIEGFKIFRWMNFASTFPKSNPENPFT